MTTMTLELTDEQARQLAEEAARLSLPVQELAARRLFAPWQPEEEKAVAPSFEEVMDYVFEKNSELYRRLA
jgi:hypothetical protein